MVHDPEAQSIEQMPTPPFEPQHLHGTGEESLLRPRPRFEGSFYRPAHKLEGLAAVITGGDSGIGRAVAVLYAREGADVTIVYRHHDSDAEETKRAVEAAGQRCHLVKGDIGTSEVCQRAAKETLAQFGRIDIVVSNASIQTSTPDVLALSEQQLEETFRTNVFGYTFIVQACLPHMRPGGAIIATGSETGLFGSEHLPDYSASKGAIHALTRALAAQLVSWGIRVNAVAPGPVWTPLNPADAGRTPEEVAHFGESTAMGRPAQPEEIAPAFVFFASLADSSYVTGQVLPMLGGVRPHP